MKTIAALLTVHNRKNKTLKCLSELFVQKGMWKDYQLDVFLTDDGCTDGTAEAVIAKFPTVHIIKGNGQLFWNRGMYKAWIEAAKVGYDFYLWLNDDTFLYPDCIVRLLSASCKHSDSAIIVGSTCATNDKTRITYGGWQNGKILSDVSIEQWSDAINGNIVLIPNSVYHVLGTNDPYYRHAVGDTDYGLRAKEKNVPCYTGVGIFGECDLHETPTVWMNTSISFSKRWKNFMSPLGNNPFEYFYFKRKHFGLLSACFTFLTMWVHFFFPQFWRKCYK